MHSCMLSWYVVHLPGHLCTCVTDGTLTYVCMYVRMYVRTGVVLAACTVRLYAAAYSLRITLLHHRLFTMHPPTHSIHARDVRTYK